MSGSVGLDQNHDAVLLLAVAFVGQEFHVSLSFEGKMTE